MEKFFHNHGEMIMQKETAKQTSRNEILIRHHEFMKCAKIGISLFTIIGPVRNRVHEFQKISPESQPL